MNVRDLPVKEVMALMRRALVPKGSAPVVAVGFFTSTANNTEYFNEAFVQQCLDDLSKLFIMQSAGMHEMTALEKLAVYLLMASAYLEDR